MTSGKNHDIITKNIAIALAIASPFTPSPALALSAAAGAYAGLYLSPDLDLPKCKARARWGVMGWYWGPYDKAIPHRSVWSHGPIIVTMGRLIYVLPLLSTITICLLSMPYITGEMLWGLRRYFVMTVVGLILADIGHWVADGMLWVWVKGVTRGERR